MRLRSSRTLVFTPTAEGEDLLGVNFLTRNVFECSADLVGLLPRDWTDIGDLVGGAFGGDRDTVDALIAHDAVVVAGSPLERREAKYLKDWRWSVPTGLMHFCLEDADFMSLEESEAVQQTRAAAGRPPKLFLRNGARTAKTPLPAALGSSPLLDLMARRRTVRKAAAPSITLAQLSDCLFAGMGIMIVLLTTFGMFGFFTAPTILTILGIGLGMVFIPRLMSSGKV